MNLSDMIVIVTVFALGNALLHGVKNGIVATLFGVAVIMYFWAMYIMIKS